MTVCNQCGGWMVPDDTALVPALGCVVCGRLMPRTGTGHRKPVTQLEQNRVKRAARRASMKGGRVAAHRHA